MAVFVVIVIILQNWITNENNCVASVFNTESTQSYSYKNFTINYFCHIRVNTLDLLLLKVNVLCVFLVKKQRVTAHSIVLVINLSLRIVRWSKLCNVILSRNIPEKFCPGDRSSKVTALQNKPLIMLYCCCLTTGESTFSHSYFLARDRCHWGIFF